MKSASFAIYKLEKLH